MFEHVDLEIQREASGTVEFQGSWTGSAGTPTPQPSFDHLLRASCLGRTMAIRWTATAMVSYTSVICFQLNNWHYKETKDEATVEKRMIRPLGRNNKWFQRLKDAKGMNRSKTRWRNGEIVWAKVDLMAEFISCKACQDSRHLKAIMTYRV